MKHEQIRGIPLPSASELLADIPHQIIEIGPRRAFREAGQMSGNEAIFILEGILSIYKTDGIGGRNILALRFAGESILPHGPTLDLGIKPMIDARLALVPDLDRAVGDHPDLAWIFWRISQRNEAIAQEWLINAARRDTKARIAHLLCEIAIRGGYGEEKMAIPLTQQQMADITGQTSVNVNRVLAEIERAGLIRRQNRQIEFLDWAELRRMAAFQPGYLEADLAGI